MTKIPLTQGKFAIIDADSYELVKGYKWYYSSHGYATNRGHRNGGHVIYMHRLIMAAQNGESIDHINRDKLDNRRNNLRVCSVTDNNRNIGLQKNNKSGFKGVFFDKRLRKYTAYITVDRTRKHLGAFTNPIAAAKAYDSAAKKHYGEYAWTNLSSQ